MLRPNKLAAVLAEPLASESIEGASAVLLVTSDGSVLSSSACSQQASQIPTHCSLEGVFRTPLDDSGSGNTTGDGTSSAATPRSGQGRTTSKTSPPSTTRYSNSHASPDTAITNKNDNNNNSNATKSTTVLVEEQHQHDIIRQQEVQSRTRVFASFAASAWNIYSKSCQRAVAVAPDLFSSSSGEQNPAPVPGTDQSTDHQNGDEGTQQQSSTTTPSIEWLTIKTQDITFLITPLLLQRSGSNSNQVLLVVAGLTSCPLGLIRLRAQALAKVLTKELRGFTLI